MDLRRLRKWLDAAARRKLLCCFGASLFVLILRVALLPVWPIPAPIIHDEFSYLLQADTFANGRLANPPHALWPFFETVYVPQQPSYASKYPPGQALAMAAGQKMLGHPWYGVWLSCGILAGVLCWALQGWFPGRWALLGTVIAIQLCFFSYWMNSYWGGAVAAIGGALVMGAWPRIGRAGAAVWLLGSGAVLLMYCRPFEGLLMLTPVFVLLLRFTRKKKIWIPLIACVLAGSAWLGFYQYRITGNPLRMPYQEYARQYESVPQFNILPVADKPVIYAHTDLELADKGWLLDQYRLARSPEFLLKRLHDWYSTLKILLGGPLLLLPLLIFAPLYFRSAKTRLPASLMAAMVAATFLEVGHFPHYVAPFTAVILILTVQSIRYAWYGRGRPIMALLLLGAFLHTGWTDASMIMAEQTPDRLAPPVRRKAGIERELAQRAAGQHVVFVRYTRLRSPHEEWIYNTANIDAQPVVWAQDMGEEENRRLIAYYPKRAFWRFEPDENSHVLKPYNGAGPPVDVP